MLRQQIASLPLGHSEQPIVVELIGTLKVNDFLKALKEKYQEAGPRGGLAPTPRWLQEERRMKREADKKAGGGGDDGGGDGGEGGGGGEAPARPVVLYRPVHIKSGSTRTGARLVLGGNRLLIKCPGVTIENVDISGSGYRGLDWGESHALVEVIQKGDLLMRSCKLSMQPAAGPLQRDGRPPPPTKNCGLVLVDRGGRATFEECSMQGSPMFYGVVARGHGSKMLMDNCHISNNFYANVLACRGARVSLVQGCSVSGSREGYGLVAVDRGSSAFCQGVTFISNSRDNVLCSQGARVVLEGCTLKGSTQRCGLKVDGPSTIAIARNSEFEGNHEHAVRAAWGGWASVRGCKYAESREDWECAVVEGPDANIVQDPLLGRPSHRYISSLERPWTERHVANLTDVISMTDAAVEAERATRGSPFEGRDWGERGPLGGAGTADRAGAAGLATPTRSHRSREEDKRGEYYKDPRDALTITKLEYTTGTTPGTSPPSVTRAGSGTGRGDGGDGGGIRVVQRGEYETVTVSR